MLSCPRFPLCVGLRRARKINVCMERVVWPRGEAHGSAVLSRRRDQNRQPAVERSRALPGRSRTGREFHQPGERGAVQAVHGQRGCLPVVEGPPANPRVLSLAPGECAPPETLVGPKVRRGLPLRHGPEPLSAGTHHGRTLREAAACPRTSQ